MSKEIRAMIVNIYKERDKAHEILLECDKAIHGILKELLKLLKK